MKPWKGLLMIFGGCVSFGLMGAVEIEGKTYHPIPPETVVGFKVPHGVSSLIKAGSRDPFKPISKPKPTPPAPQISNPKTPSVPEVKDPDWRLLGILRGPDGHRAVIELTPKKRVVVQQGSELPPSGWRIKTIREQEVLLEHLSFSLEKRLSSPTRHFILSFAPNPKSP